MRPTKALMKSGVALGLSLLLLPLQVVGHGSRCVSAASASCFSEQAFTEPLLVGMLKPFHRVVAAYLRSQAPGRSLLHTPGFFSRRQSLRWNLVSMAQQWMLSAPARFQPLPDVPFHFSRFLRAYGLEVSKVEVHTLFGQAPPADFLSSEPIQCALRISAAQALGAYLLAGREMKDISDGNAVEVGEQQMLAFTAEHPLTAISIFGDEGAKDGAPSLKVMTIYYAGKKFSPDVLEEFRAKLRELHALGYRIYGYVGDAIDNTAGQSSPAALLQPTNSWSFLALFEGIDPLTERPYFPFVHDQARITGWTYFAPEDANVLPLDPPSIALPKIARAWARAVARERGIVYGSRDYAIFEDNYIRYFINRTLLLMLGNRSVRKATDPDVHRHQPMIDLGKIMRRYFPGLQVRDFAEGDATPRVVAARGISNDGLNYIWMGRGGATENVGVALSAEPNGSHFPRMFVSNEATNSTLNDFTAHFNRFSEQDLKMFFHDFGLPLESFQGILSKTGHHGWVVATAITGASKSMIGDRLASLLQRVAFTDGSASGQVVVNTLVAAPDGSTYVVRMTLHTNDLAQTRLSILNASARSRSLSRGGGPVSTSGCAAGAKGVLSSS